MIELRNGVEIVPGAHAGYGCTYAELGESVVGDHANGWMVEGEIVDDVWRYVSRFTALHPVHGMVAGNLNASVLADSLAGWEAFTRAFPLEWTDPGDV